MKKLLSLFIVLVLCLSVLAACENVNVTVDGTSATTAGGTTAAPVNTEDALKKATAFLKDKYKNLLTVPETAADFEVASTVMVSGVSYTVTWTVDKTDVKIVAGSEGNVKVDVNEKSPEVLNYVLTAVVSAADGTKGSPLSFNLTVPKYSVLSHAEYMKAEKDQVVTIEGIVTGINSVSQGNKRNHLFLTDASGVGGYYCYNMVTDPATDGIKVGMTVSVSGTVSPYSGMQEIKDCTATIVDSTVKAVTPVDLTEVFKTATSETSFADYVGQLVTIKGVTVGGQDLAKDTDQYLHFSIGSVESYLRTYLTDMACGATEAEKTTIKTAIDTAQAAKFGWTANVTGIVVLYNKVPYLIPVSQDCFEYTELVEKTDAEKVATEKDELTLQDAVNADIELDLAAAGKYYNTVAITWEITDGASCAVIEGGKLKITLQSAAITLKVRATITSGSTTETKEFTIAVAAAPTSAPVAVETPVVGKAYKILLVHTNMNNKLCYITGEAGSKEYYWATTENSSSAADVYLEETTGGYYLYIMKGTDKVYLNIRKNGNYVNCLYEATASAVFTWDATLKTMVTVVEENTYTFGIKNTSTYDTLEAKKVGDAATVPAQLVEMVEVGPQIAENLVVNTPYKILLIHTNMNDKHCYITGEAGSKPYYWATTDNVLKAADVYLEEVTGGYNLYIMKGTDKVYLNIKQNGNYVNCLYEAAPDAVYTWDATLKTLVTKVGEKTYTFGIKNSSTYDTLEAKDVNDAATVIAHFVTWVGPLPEEEPAPELPANSVKYTFADYEKGTQYAENEAHELDATLKVTNNKGHFTTQLRLYKGSNAVFESKKVINSLVVRCGYKADVLTVYGSVDGTTWTQIQVITATTAYADYDVTIENSTYKFIKLEPGESQIRVESITVSYAE